MPETPATALITTPFGFDSTAADVAADVDLTGRRAIVTGGSSGIGIETARALAGAGAELTLAVRDLETGARTAAEIAATTGGPAPHVERLDLADRSSVAAFVAGWTGALDLLVNNAGVMALPDLVLSADGCEMQFATNHLGHFALAVGLHDALAAAGSARIVSLSSVGHLRSAVIFDDLNFTSRPYDARLAYGQSKTANVLFAVEAARRWKSDGITVNALTPGRIRTNLMRHIGDETSANAPASFQATNPEMRWKTLEQGAATSVLLAASPLVKGVTGRYFEDCNEAGLRQPGELRGVADYAIDPGNAA
ncbi:MAG TPA: SDR family NAD(P)-dependent oxidoreductase, partial [Solirubrobacteraceae bacterium]|nr:SDR family NAD(P)-dependent oxidoreductase [Solirubrobacteraceae bacterium]